MHYVTDTELARLPALENLDTQGRDQALTDAGRVYRYVGRNEWLTEDELRAYGERNDLPPDRLNRALTLLADAGKIATTGTTPAPVIAVPVIEQQPDEPAPDPEPA